MSFKENLLQKINIDALARKISRSMGPADSNRRLDKEAMTTLLKWTDFVHRKERDLDLYCRQTGDGDLILVLDNELKLYRTDIADVVLRKSPTVKEMVSIRNAIKILNDKDVVISARQETVATIARELIAGLDLNFDAADIAALVKDGLAAMDHQYAEGVTETLALMAEIAQWDPAPKQFALAHHQIYGITKNLPPADARFGPAVLFDRMHHRLIYLDHAIDSRDAAQMEAYSQLTGHPDPADKSGKAAWIALEAAIRDKYLTTAERAEMIP